MAQWRLLAAGAMTGLLGMALQQAPVLGGHQTGTDPDRAPHPAAPLRRRPPLPRLIRGGSLRRGPGVIPPDPCRQGP